MSELGERLLFPPHAWAGSHVMLCATDEHYLANLLRLGAGATLSRRAGGKGRR